jgi:hypothetical protein
LKFWLRIAVVMALSSRQEDQSMRGRSLLVAIVLLGAATAANATPIKWSDAAPSFKATGHTPTIPELGSPQYSAAQLASTSSAYDASAFVFSGFGELKSVFTEPGNARRNNASIVSLLNDFFLGHSSLITPPSHESSVTPVSVPEPATLGMLGLGLFGVGLASRSKR